MIKGIDPLKNKIKNLIEKSKEEISNNNIFTNNISFQRKNINKKLSKKNNISNPKKKKVIKLKKFKIKNKLSSKYTNYFASSRSAINKLNKKNFKKIDN